MGKLASWNLAALRFHEGSHTAERLSRAEQHFSDYGRSIEEVCFPRAAAARRLWRACVQCAGMRGAKYHKSLCGALQANSPAASHCTKLHLYNTNVSMQKHAKPPHSFAGVRRRGFGYVQAAHLRASPSRHVAQHGLWWSVVELWIERMVFDLKENVRDRVEREP